MFMNNFNIQQIFDRSYDDFSSAHYQTSIQKKAAHAVMNCKTGAFGMNTVVCSECGHVEVHHNSCRDRNCPNCQAVKKEIWVDKRRAEVIDVPYFHVVFTLPHELNPLLYHNQSLLYGLFHKCCAETLLELSANKKYLGAVPGIIQVLHTWNQVLDYHVHMHCIVSGGGLTPDKKLRKSKDSFFIPVRVLRNKFKAKFLSLLDRLFKAGDLYVPKSMLPLNWSCFKNTLFEMDWCPYIKKTFNGFGNAIEYLGRYTHKIAISNSRIISVSDTHVSFSARALKPGDKRRTITLTNVEFIRKFLMHVLPKRFQKIRYYGFLNNRMKSKNLRIIFDLQGKQRFKRYYENLSIPELIKTIWKKDICLCPVCGKSAMRMTGRNRCLSHRLE